MLAKSAVRLFDGWDSQWFFLDVSETSLRHSGRLPRHSGPWGLRDVVRPMGTSLVEEWELAGIKSARSERSFRDLLEEMVMGPLHDEGATTGGAGDPLGFSSPTLHG